MKNLIWFRKIKHTYIFSTKTFEIYFNPPYVWRSEVFGTRFVSPGIVINIYKWKKKPKTAIRKKPTE